MTTEGFFKGHWAPGVLSKGQMRELKKNEYITDIDDFEKAASFSSINLTLDSIAFEMVNGSTKPCGMDVAYSEILNRYGVKIEPEDGFFKLKSKHCYVFRLKERLTAQINKSHLFAQATARSSIGRMDVIARLIVDGQSQYDSFDSTKGIKSGYLYLEVIPISFNVRVKVGCPLTQIRFFYGEMEECIIRDTDFVKELLHESDNNTQGFLSVNLVNTHVNNSEVSAFCAIDTNPDDYIDLFPDGDEAKLDPTKYWRFIKSTEDRRITIESGKFYIINSKELISLPPSVAVYARAMDESLGEMRIHYAGFVHPFFGYKRDDGLAGTPLIFEVRGHSVNVNLAHEERLARLLFYRMSEDADINDDDDKSYSKQRLKLSKMFDDWPENISVDSSGRVSPGGET